MLITFGCKPKSKVFEFRNRESLTSFPDSLFDSKDYRVIRIIGSECDFTDAACPNLKEIPEVIREMKELEELYFILHRIEEVPMFLRGLGDLKVLDLSDNIYLRKFDGLCVLNRLEILSLNGCNLSDLPHCVLSLKKLKVLGLEGNYFSEETKSQIREALPNVKIYF